MSNLLEAQRTANTHQCATCKHESALVVRWEGSGWVVRCGKCNGMGLRKPPSLLRMWRDDPNSVPATISSVFERKYGVKEAANLHNEREKLQ